MLHAKEGAGPTKGGQRAAQGVARAEDAVGGAAAGQLAQHLAHVHGRVGVVHHRRKLLQEACSRATQPTVSTPGVLNLLLTLSGRVGQGMNLVVDMLPARDMDNGRANSKHGKYLCAPWRLGRRAAGSRCAAASS